MLKPYVEIRNNLVKEPANVNVLVSETRTFSNNSRSSHFSPTDTTKLTNFSVVRNLDSELSRLEESQRQDLEKLLQEYEVLFPDVPPTTDQTYHGIDRRISLILLNKKRKLAFTNNTFRGTSFLSR